MIGSQAVAEAAHRRELDSFSHNGTTRRVYVEDGIVYKVDRYDDTNSAEIANLKRLSTLTLPDGIRIPEWAEFDVNGEPVIAMSFVSGTELFECYCAYTEMPCDCDPNFLVPADVENTLRTLGIDDIGNGNVIRDDTGVFWLIDVAE